jgi:hypothetical protein
MEGMTMNQESPAVPTSPVALFAADQSGKNRVRRVGVSRRMQTDTSALHEHDVASATVPMMEIASPTVAPSECGVTKEDELGASIIELWAKGGERSARIKKTRAALNKLRCELGEKLSELKKLVCVPGREGGWTEKCAGLGIAKRTADRLVRRHHAGHGDHSGNLASGQIGRRLTHDEVHTVARKIACKLAGRLDDSVNLEVVLEIFAFELHNVLSLPVIDEANKAANEAIGA